MKFTHALTLLAIAWLSPFASLHGENEASQKPNIIFILFDDMGYGQPKCYREGTEFKTPNIDRLAKEGMRFTDAHSAASVCTPTRYGLLTGRYPSRIGQYGVLTTYSPPIIPKTRMTVASLLKQNGYDTACIGKWHLGMDWGGKPGNETAISIGTQLVTSPNAAGFDYFYGFTHARNIGTVIEIVERLTALMRRHMADGRSTPGAAQKNEVTEARFSSDPSVTPRKKQKKAAK